MPLLSHTPMERVPAVKACAATLLFLAAASLLAWPGCHRKEAPSPTTKGARTAGPQVAWAQVVRRDLAYRKQ